MNNTAKILAALGTVMFIVICWRVITGGPIGPKSYALIAATVAVFIAAVVIGKRSITGSPDSRTPRG